jgi:hypothetical protein
VEKIRGSLNMHPITKYYREMSHRLIEEYYEGENNAEVNYNYTSDSDPVVERVVDKFRSRSQAGIKKYGVTLERDDLSKREWLIHLQEELMDAVNYIEVHLTR